MTKNEEQRLLRDVNSIARSLKMIAIRFKKGDNDEKEKLYSYDSCCSGSCCGASKEEKTVAGEAK